MGSPTKWQHISAADIERQSMLIIDEELKRTGIELDPAIKPVVMRAIHATADFDYAHNLLFSKNAIDAALAALTEGATIVTDTNMALAGINKSLVEQLGCKTFCFMADKDVAAEAKRRNTTRAEVSMERASSLMGPLVFSIGNAPTALKRLCELATEGSVSPRLVVCAPVGFVNVEASKELSIKTFTDLGIEHIVARGRKGGSTVSVAIINALLGEAARSTNNA